MVNEVEILDINKELQKGKERVKAVNDITLILKSIQKHTRSRVIHIQTEKIFNLLRILEPPLDHDEIMRRVYLEQKLYEV